MLDAALVFAVVVAVNLLPAFGPPTSAVLLKLDWRRVLPGRRPVAGAPTRTSS